MTCCQRSEPSTSARQRGHGPTELHIDAVRHGAVTGHREPLVGHVALGPFTSRRQRLERPQLRRNFVVY